MSVTQRFWIAFLFLIGGALIVFGVFKLIKFGKLMTAAAQPVPHISQPQPVVVSEPPPLSIIDDPSAVTHGATVIPAQPMIPQAFITYTDTACIYLSTLGGIAVLPKRAGGC